MKGVRFAEVPVASTPFVDRKDNYQVTSTPNTMGKFGYPQTPNQVSPDEDDRKNLAGRTPHNKKLEAAKTMEMFSKQLFGAEIMPDTPVNKNKWSLEVICTPLEKSLNVSVISPDPCDSTGSPAPLTPYKADLLFGTDSPESVMKQPVAMATILPEVETQGPSFSIASTHADKIHFILPDEAVKSRNDFPKKIQATPYFERPNRPSTVESSEHNVVASEVVSSPNASTYQQLAQSTSVSTPIINDSVHESTVSPVKVSPQPVASVVISPSPSEKSNISIEKEDCAKSLFDSPSQSNAVETITVSDPPHLPVPQEVNVSFTEHLLQQQEPKRTSPAPMKIDFRYSKSPVQVEPVKAMESFNNVASPLVLHRSGGVSKGRGPSSSSVAITRAPQITVVPTGFTEKQFINRAPTEASLPIGQPAVAYPASPAARKAIPFQPKADFACSPITVPIEAQENVNMCNVSIQTSMIFDQPIAATKANDDSSIQVDDLIRSQIASAPVVHYSPMFTSYVGNGDVDSDEEDNMTTDCALMDLLKGTTPSSPILKQLSSVISPSSKPITNTSFTSQTNRSFTSIGGAKRVSIKEHKQSEVDAEESDDDYEPVVLSDYSQTGRDQPSLHSEATFPQQQAKKSFQVPDIHNYTVRSEDVSQLNHSLSMVNDLAILDATDAAVMLQPEERSEIYFSDDENVIPLNVMKTTSPIKTVDYSVAETTMTLDQGDDDSFMSPEERNQPRLAITNLKRSKEAIPDVKEVILQCNTGSFTTTVLSFSNRQRKPISMKTQAIQIRYEPSNTENKDFFNSNPASYFRVSPNELNILPGEDNQLYITFSPPKGASGVYSGVVKIKSNKKAFTLLLRGEASTPLIPPSQYFKPIATNVVQSEVTKVNEDNMVFTAPIENIPKVVERSYRSSLVQEIYRKNIEEAAAKPSSFALQTQSLLQQRQRDLQQRILDLKKKQESPKVATPVFSSIKTNIPVSSVLQQSPVNQSISIADGLVVDETLSIDQVASSNQFEGNLFIRNESNKSSTMYVTGSNIWLKCMKTSYKIVAKSSLSVRVMIDCGSTELHQLIRRTCSQASSSGCQLGFLTVKCEGQEFNIDVSMSRANCNIIDQLHNSVVPTRHHAEVSALNSSAEATLSVDVTKVDVHSAERKSSKHHNEEIEESFHTTKIDHHSSRRTAHHEYVNQYSELKKGTYAVKESQQHSRKSSSKDKVKSGRSSGVYFRLSEARFGAVAIGSLTRTRIELCNGTDEEMTVYLSDPALPFVLLPVHSEIHLRPRSYVRVPLRFIPVASGEFNEQLIAQTVDGSYHSSISLNGFACDNK